MAPLPLPEGQNKKFDLEVIGVYARLAGFVGEDLVTAMAVAMAESGGDAGDISPRNANGTNDYGLWQINSVHADLFTKYPNWWLPDQNAKMAFTVFQAQGWGAWTVYKTGAYLPFKAAAQAMYDTHPGVREGTGVAGKAETITINPLTQLANGVIGVAQAVFKAAAWMSKPHNWVRAGIGLVGGALIVGALVVLAKPAISGAANVVTQVTPVGAARKAV